MGNKLKALLQVSVVIARDMLIGMIFGLTAAILLAKINPHTENIAVLLVPTGIIAGILKGFTKYLILKMVSSLPTKGYRFIYPKYRLLFLWLALLLGAWLYAYGFNVSTRFAALHNWTTLILVVSVIGIASYLFEPPYNTDEILPPEKDDEQK